MIVLSISCAVSTKDFAITVFSKAITVFISLSEQVWLIELITWFAFSRAASITARSLLSNAFLNDVITLFTAELLAAGAVSAATGAAELAAGAVDLGSGVVTVIVGVGEEADPLRVEGATGIETLVLPD